MSIEVWLAFLLAAIIVCVIPGPTTLLVSVKAMRVGMRSLLPLVTGVVLGDLTGMTLSLIGLGSILLVSSELFLALKWVGVLYLIYLGVRMWQQASQPVEVNTRIDSSRAMFRSAYWVTAFNPKSITFFVAFLPQFINTNASLMPQIMILMATFLMVVVCNISFYTVFASYLRNRINNPAIHQKLNRAGGGALIGTAVIVAAAAQSK